MEKIAALTYELPQDWPSHILKNIFKNLCFSDRLAAGLTCKHWFNATSAPEFMSDCLIKIHNKEDRETLLPEAHKIDSAFRLFTNASRKFRQYHFQDVNMEHKNAVDLGQVISGHIEVLTLFKCQIRSATLVTFLKNAPQLKSLELILMDADGWRLSDFSELSNKTKIIHLGWIDDTRFISDDVFNALVVMTPKLESLKISVEHGLDGLGGIMKMLGLQIGGDSVLRPESLLSFIEKTKSTLKTIYLDEGPMSRVIEAFLIMNEVKFENIHLGNLMFHFDPTDLTEFLFSQNKLKKLTLQNMASDDKTMVAISKMKKLQELYIHQKNSQRMSDFAMIALSKLKHLKKLSLITFEQITPNGLKNLLRMKLENFTSLQLEDMPQITSDCFEKIIERLVNLEVFVVKNCPKMSTNALLLKVFQYMVNLKTLVLEDAEKITDYGFCHPTINIKSLTHLRNLELSDCARLNNKCLKTIKLPLIQLIRLSGTSKVTLEGIKIMIPQNPALEQLAVIGVVPTNLCEIGETFARANMKRLKWVKFAAQE